MPHRLNQPKASFHMPIGNGLLKTGGMAPPQGRGHQGTSEDQDPPRRVEIPGCPFGRRMVDQQGGQSAQIYWGRMAALLLRLVYNIFPLADWGFVFVDDFCWLLRKTLAEPLTTSILLFLVAIGCPLSWKKTAIGSSNTWLGFLVTPSQQLVRMAPAKHELVMSVLSRMMENEEFTRPELDSALGRLQWATTCCPLTKPFLQAFWQWRVAVKSSGRPSKLLRGFAKLLQLV